MENNIAGIPIEDLKPLAIKYKGNDSFESLQKIAVKISVARAARLSYMTFDGEIDYEKDLKLHDTLLESQHMSPFEHCARAMSDYEYSKYTHTYPIDNDGTFDEEEGWCNNFRGFIQYRYLIENKS